MGLVLASASPRRYQLLLAAGVPIHAVLPSQIPEEAHPGEAPIPFARRIAREKARAVHAPGQWVLAADTVVYLEGRIMGKPCDDEDARAMLSRLAGRWHRVTTAWSLVPPDAAPGFRGGTAHRTSRVLFRPLSPADVARYVAHGEGRDKAGAYAIQGEGMALVERVVGSYTNVIGLPVAPVLQWLVRAGLC